jgi:TolB protein
MKAIKIIIPILILMAILLLIRLTGIFDAPPAITDISVGNNTGTGAIVSWQTDKPASSQVYYGQSATYDSKTGVDNRQVTSHSVNIGGLKPGMTYHFSAVSISSGKQAISLDMIFTTLVQKIVYESRPGGDARIFIMNADGTNPAKLTSGPNDDMMPKVSHDGKKIAFASDRDGKSQIYIMDIDGDNIKQLTYSYQGVNIAPAWSPDDTQISFGSSRENTGQIWVMNVDGSNLRKLTSGDRGVCMNSSWSPDRKKIAFQAMVVTDPWKFYIYSIDLDSGAVTRLTDTGLDMSPDWSPDGKKIAFSSSRGQKQAIYTMNPNGSGVTLLTSDTAIDNYPCWSPDGNKIAFASKRDGSDWQIYSMNADGSGLARLTNNTYEQTAPSWSPFMESQKKQ